MSKKLFTILSASLVTITAVVAGTLLFQQQDPTLDDVPFIPASDAVTEPVVDVNVSNTTVDVVDTVNTNQENNSQDQEARIKKQELGNTNSSTVLNSNTTTTADVDELEDLGQTIVVTISGPDIAKRCVVDVAEPMSVHQVMKHASQQCNFSYVGKQFSGLGFFVDELAGKLSDTKSGKYWIFYVNGLKASVGVSAQLVRAGDIIAWQFENEISN